MIEPAPREEPQHTRCILGAPSRGAYPWPWLSYLALHHCGVFVREPPSLMKLHAFVLSTEHAINDGAVEMQVGIERGAEPMEKVHRPEAGICWCAGTAGLEAVLECFEKDP